MHTSIKLALATVAVASSAGLVATAPASATPPVDMHCPSGGVKYNGDGASTTLTLPAGTQFCVKSSTTNTGILTSDGSTWTNTIVNQNNNPRVISYYVIYGESCTPNPSNPSQCLPS